MKKIAIVTLFGLYNYGNRLQNYAAQEIIKSIGYDVESIVCHRSRWNYFVHLVNNLLKPFYGSDSFRVWRFWKFNRLFVPERFIYNRRMRFPTNIADEYDGFVVGSDQVWNPTMRRDERYNFFLQFAKPAQRIALAPSIAVDQIPENLTQLYIEGLNGFHNISVRESSSVGLIKELTNKDAVLLVDPTLALESSIWHDLAEKSNKSRRVNEPYLLTYFLGKVSDEYNTCIRKTAEENGLIIVRLNDLEDRKMHSCTPDEFLYLIKHASLFITDSFHGCVFSIIFHTPFFARERENKLGVKSGTESRLVSLLETFGLLDRYNESEISLKSPNFSYSDEVLVKKREEFLSYIRGELSRI